MFASLPEILILLNELWLISNQGNTSSLVPLIYPYYDREKHLSFSFFIGYIAFILKEMSIKHNLWVT